jgi:hypothetical protein
MWTMPKSRFPMDTLTPARRKFGCWRPTASGIVAFCVIYTSLIQRPPSSLGADRCPLSSRVMSACQNAHHMQLIVQSSFQHHEAALEPE